jgi:hypothetical protein
LAEEGLVAVAEDLVGEGVVELAGASEGEGLVLASPKEGESFLPDQVKL